MKKLEKVFLLSPQFGLCKGGIQTWAYYIDKLLKNNNIIIESYGLRDIKLRQVMKFFKSILTCDRVILMTWKMGLIIFPILFFSKRKVFILVHGDEILKQNKVYQLFLLFLLRRDNTCFLANSMAVANIFEKEFGSKVDRIFYPFIQDKTESFVKKKNKNPIFFTVTRLVKRKNISNTIKALRILSDEGVDFKYYIAGRGEEKENLENLVKDNNLQNQVIFLDRITEDEKEDYMKKSDLFLLPSIFDDKAGSIEGFGIVYIEANTYGLPVISGNTGGIVEAVIDGNTGFHTEGTVDSIYLAIKKSLDYKWNSSEIIKYAKRFDYNKQLDFLKFIKDE